MAKLSLVEKRFEQKQLRTREKTSEATQMDSYVKDYGTIPANTCNPKFKA